MDSSSTRTNWAGDFTYAARTLHEPRSVEELRHLPQRVLDRYLGSD